MPILCPLVCPDIMGPGKSITIISELMNSALLVRKFIITLILIIFTNISKVEAADTVINNGGTTTSQQGLSSNEDTLTISNESTLTRANTAVNVTANEVSVTVWL